MLQENLALKLEKFADHLFARKGLRENTIIGYCRIASKVLRDMEEFNPSPAQLERYVAGLQRAGKYSYYHLRNITLAIEAYSSFLGDPVKFGRPRKPKPILKDTMSEAEQILIIHACRNLREKALISLLAYSGIRCQELCNLRVCDVDAGANIIRVVDGKNRKSRVVCIAAECTRILIDYLAAYPRLPGEYLFTAVRTGKQLSTWAIRKIVRSIAARVLPGRRVHPHLFRHSLATCMLNRGANLMTIKEQLGHAFIETTMIYLRSSFARIDAEYRIFAPRLV